MNKRLLAIAVGAALVAGSALVANAEVKLYGSLHMSLDRLDNDEGLERSFVSSNASRIGVRGDEDLGGGLKAVFQVETGGDDTANQSDGGGGFPMDSGAGGLGGTLRETFVGFKGGFGTALVGRYVTPYRQLGRKFDLFNEQIGDARLIIGQGGGGFDKRLSNTIRYESPKFGGADLIVQYSGNDGTDEAAAGTQNAFSTAVNWAAGPLFIGSAYEKHSTAAGQEETGIRLVGHFDVGGGFGVGALWETLSDLNGTSGADRNALGLFAKFKAGNNTFKAHLYDQDKIDNQASENGAKLWAIGVDHSFSKNTLMYLNYAAMDNDPNSTRTVSGSSQGHGERLAPTTGGKSPTGISIGMNLKF